MATKDGILNNIYAFTTRELFDQTSIIRRLLIVDCMTSTEFFPTVVKFTLGGGNRNSFDTLSTTELQHRCTDTRCGSVDQRSLTFLYLGDEVQKLVSCAPYLRDRS